MKGKTSKTHFFDVDLNWIGDTRGTLRSDDTGSVITIGTPVEFGGTAGSWSPEHLFLGAVNSCYLTTLLSFANKVELAIRYFECQAIGQVEIVEGRYKFTNINLYPRISIDKPEWEEKVRLVVEKTHKYCLVSSSVNASIYYHPEIIVPGIDDKISENIQHRSTGNMP
jgi:peroxiredoxin-like protein